MVNFRFCRSTCEAWQFRDCREESLAHEQVRFIQSQRIPLLSVQFCLFLKLIKNTLIDNNSVKSDNFITPSFHDAGARLFCVSRNFLSYGPKRNRFMRFHRHLFTTGNPQNKWIDRINYRAKPLEPPGCRHADCKFHYTGTYIVRKSALSVSAMLLSKLGN